MNPPASRDANRAFTLIELLVVVAILAILFAMVVPIFDRREPGGRRVICLNNLKQVNLGFMLYQSDYANKFPWQFSTNQGGTEELIPRGIASEHFVKLSTYLLQPKKFVCPTDKSRRAATSLTNFSNANLSYFVALDVITNSASGIVVGDRHLKVNGNPAKPGLLVLATNVTVNWTSELHPTPNPPAHGNLAFADGHAEGVRSHKLTEYFQRQLLLTNRLVIP